MSPRGPFDSTFRLGAFGGDEDFWPIALGNRGDSQREHHSSTPAVLRPKMNWIEQEEKNIVTFELPGLAKKDVDLTLHDTLLLITVKSGGDTHTTHNSSHCQTERREALYGALRVPSGSRACMQDGLLKIECPKQKVQREECGCEHKSGKVLVEWWSAGWCVREGAPREGGGEVRWVRRSKL